MEQQSAPSGVSSRTGRPAIPREHIIRAALELLDESGASEFSLRALAKHMNSSTATLYRHFASKDELLAEVGEFVLGQAWEALRLRNAAAPERGDWGEFWQDRVFSAADALFQMCEEHPRMVAILANDIAVGPNALVMREYVLAGLIEAGFAPEVASQAFTSIMRCTLGFSAQLVGSDPSEGEAGMKLGKFFAGLDPKQFPAIAASARYLPAGLRDEFEFGLGCLLDGLAAKKPR